AGRAVGRARRGCRDREDAAGAAGGLHVGAVRDGQGRSEQAAGGRAMEELARAARAVEVADAGVVVVRAAGAQVAARLGRAGPGGGRGLDVVLVVVVVVVVVVVGHG